MINLGLNIDINGRGLKGAGRTGAAHGVPVTPVVVVGSVRVAAIDVDSVAIRRIVRSR